MLIQAIKYIGRGKIREEDIKRLSQVIPEKFKSLIIDEAKTTTSWINQIVKEVCA